MGSNALGERLRFARGLSGLSKHRLDEVSGLTIGHTAHIESGRRPNPEARTIIALCTALGCSADWLLRGEGEPPTRPRVRCAVAEAELRRAEMAVAS